MLFLVQIVVSLPADLAAEQRSALIAAERARGRELIRGGVIERIWRIPDPGRLHNVGVWHARDDVELHEHLATLPLHRWMNFEITPVTTHPLETGE